MPSTLTRREFYGINRGRACIVQADKHTEVVSMKRRDCNHNEQYLLDAIGRRSGVQVNAHDCDYVDARNALIPVAMRAASETGALQNSHEWSRQFVAAMERLVRERGLVKVPTVIQ